MVTETDSLRKTYLNKNFKVKIVYENNKEDQLKIQPWTSVKELKSKISKKIFKNPQLIRIFYRNTEFMDKRTMLEYQVIDDDDPVFNVKLRDQGNKKLGIQVYGNFPSNETLREIIQEIKFGFLHGYAPNLIQDGTGGIYNLKNSKRTIIALFKPIDEEAFTPNNQKGYTGKFGQQSFRNGILSGEGSIREVVAYILDHNGFLNVPDTTFVEIIHQSFNKNSKEMLLFDKTNFKKMKLSITHNFIVENLLNLESNGTIKDDDSLNSEETEKISEIYTKKYGSLQKFINKSEVAANFSSEIFDTDQVHRIAILDIRILNCDRNDENILVVKKKKKLTNQTYFKLIPIDHSLSLPDIIEIHEYEMCWMGWSQSKKNFSKEMLEYIKGIDINEDIKRISKNIKIREKCLKNFRISNTLLKKGAIHGLTPFQIGSILYRPEYDETPSKLEILLEKTNSICNVFLSSNIRDKLMIKELEGITSRVRKNQISTDDDNSNVNASSTLYLEKYESEVKANYDQLKNDDLKGQALGNECEYDGLKVKNHVKSEKEGENNHQPRKVSLLQRTSSEPSLIKEASTDIIEETKEKVKKRNKFDKKKKFDYMSIDSPFNNLFFYYFEQMLDEFLNNEYKIK